MVAGYTLELFNKRLDVTCVVLSWPMLITLIEVEIKKRTLYLGVEGKYELGPMRHFSCNVVAVKMLTLPSSKAAYIDWLSHEYTASVTEPLDSFGIHYIKRKRTDQALKDIAQKFNAKL